MKQRLAELEARVAALEDLLAPQAGELDVALLSRLRRGSAEGGGSVQIAGSVAVGERRAAWQRIHPTADLVTSDVDAVARTVAAIGHPARVAILVALLDGPKRASDLDEALGLGSTGRLYHHLKELLAAGVIVQPQRSVYDIPAAAVVPILAMIAAARDLGASAS